MSNPTTCVRTTIIIRARATKATMMRMVSSTLQARTGPDMVTSLMKDIIPRMMTEAMRVMSMTECSISKAIFKEGESY